MCVQGPTWNNNIPGQHSTSYMAGHGQVKHPFHLSLFQYNENCFSQALCPLAALRVPLYQALSTPGCAASSVSSQMVSVAVVGGKKQTYEALGNDYGFLGQVTWTILV